MLKSLINDQRGFTFLEMSIVVAIIGILMLMAIPNYQGAAVKAQERSCEANRKMIETQVSSYIMDQPTDPQTMADLVTAGYLKSEPICPVDEAGYTFKIVPATNSFPGEINVYCPTHEPEPPPPAI